MRLSISIRLILRVGISLSILIRRRASICIGVRGGISLIRLCMFSVRIRIRSRNRPIMRLRLGFIRCVRIRVIIRVLDRYRTRICRCVIMWIRHGMRCSY